MTTFRKTAGGSGLLPLICALAFLLPAPEAQGQSVAEFARSVRAAVESGDFTTLKQLVATSRDMSIRCCFSFEIGIAQATAADDADEVAALREAMNQLAVTYKLQYSDEFLVDREKWFKTLDADALGKHLTAQDKFGKAFDMLNEAKKEGGDVKMREAAEAFAETRALCVETGDGYLASSCAFRAAEIHESLADNFGAAYWWTIAEADAQRVGMKPLADSARSQLDRFKSYDKVKRMDLIDPKLPLEEARKAHEKAYEESLVVDLGEGGGDSGGTLTPPVPPVGNEWVDDKGFKTVELDIGGRVLVPWYSPGVDAEHPSSMPFAWRWGLAKDTQDAEFPFSPAATVSWDGKLEVDFDGKDGKGRPKKLKLKPGKPAKQTYEVVYDDNTKRKVAIEIIDRAKKDNVFGEKFEWTDEGQLQAFVRGITGIKGKIRGTPVTIVDANARANFNEYGEDVVIVGSGRDERIDPLGRYVYLPTDKGWYPFEIKVIDKNGDLVRTKPYIGELAPLKVEYSTSTGKRPDFLVARGSGEEADFFVDLMKAVDEFVWVPATTLTIHRGFFVEGRGKKQTSILIGKGTSKGFKVEPGRMNVWKLGGAGDKGFYMTAQFSREDGEVVFKGTSLRVYGNAGEEYFNFLAGRPMPQIELRRGDENGAKVGKEEAREPMGNVGFTDVFFPGDVKFDRAPSEKLVAKLQARHPILGDIGSDWIVVD